VRSSKPEGKVRQSHFVTLPSASAMRGVKYGLNSGSRRKARSLAMTASGPEVVPFARSFSFLRNSAGQFGFPARADRSQPGGLPVSALS
jgi:hypothetical protein